MKQKKINKMNEDLLHFIWKNKLYNSLQSDSYIETVDSGTQNADAGPDFFNAKLKINGILWAGNIEIHRKSSDWDKHKHQNDKAYDNVILQIVSENDKDVYNSKGEKVLTAELNFPVSVIHAYEKLKTSNQTIPCSEDIKKIDPFTVNSWLSRILTERLERKTEYIQSILHHTKNNWEESFYIILAGSFGFKVNAFPFELLAKSLPLIILAKNKTDRFKIEALLFGQAGFLNDELNDVYYQKVKKEYGYQKNKYKLKPIDKHLWKFLRIRPLNFPTVRISQFAALIYTSSNLLSKVLEAESTEELYKMFHLQTSDYWDTHYSFGKKSEKKIKKLGKTSTDSIIINTVIPFLFIYGKLKNKDELCDRAILFLELMKAENNKIVKNWESLGIQAKNAYFSQALLQLYNEYCLKKKCLHCRIGNHFIQTYV